MPGVVRIVFGVALLHNLEAHLEKRFLEFCDALAGLDFDVHRSIAELVPEIGIGDEPARLFARESRPFGDVAKRVVHCPVQAREERHDLLPAGSLVISQSLLGSPDRNVDKEIALDRRPAELEVQLGFKRDRLEKLIR